VLVSTPCCQCVPCHLDLVRAGPGRLAQGGAWRSSFPATSTSLLHPSCRPGRVVRGHRGCAAWRSTARPAARGLPDLLFRNAARLYRLETTTCTCCNGPDPWWSCTGAPGCARPGGPWTPVQAERFSGRLSEQGDAGLPSCALRDACCRFAGFRGRASLPVANPAVRTPPSARFAEMLGERPAGTPFQARLIRGAATPPPSACGRHPPLPVPSTMPTASVAYIGAIFWS